MGRERESSKSLAGGLVKLHDSYFVHNQKIFDKIYTRNLVSELELAFPYLFCQNSRVACFYDF